MAGDRLERRRDVIVIGASWGGVDALRRLVSIFPPGLPAAVFVVLHIAPGSSSALPFLLDRAGPLRARHPDDGEAFEHGVIYIAPPDRHLLVEPGCARLSTGPRENRARPAIDPLFRSAAGAYGSRVAGVILTGALDDGTAGLRHVKECGGVALVQDPSEAFCPDMPRSALAHVAVDYCLPLTALATTLVALATAPLASAEPDRARGGAPMADDDQDFEVSRFTCPDCHGTLWSREGDVLEFRCRIGHRYSAESMTAALDDSVERAQWAAVRALEEKAELHRRLARRIGPRDPGMLARYEETAADCERQAAILRDAISHAEQGNAVG